MSGQKIVRQYYLTNRWCNKQKQTRRNKMKCIKKGEDIKRVEDSRATKMVDQGWTYCDKSDWKKKGSKVAKEDMPVESVKKEKTSNKKEKKEKKIDSEIKV